MSDFILVVIKAGNCSACHGFGQHMQTPLLESIKRTYHGLEAVFIELKQMGNKIPENYPASLIYWYRWYPTILLVSKKDWEIAMKDPNAELKTVFIFDGIRVDIDPANKKFDIKQTNEYTFSVDQILLWIKNTIDLSQMSRRSEKSSKKSKDESIIQRKGGVSSGGLKDSCAKTHKLIFRSNKN